jgi:transposase
MARHVINDALWVGLKRLLPKMKGRKGINDRNFIEVVAWIMRTGAPWRDMPIEFGPWKTVCNRYSRWARLGVIDKTLQTLKKRWDYRRDLYDRFNNN